MLADIGPCLFNSEQLPTRVNKAHDIDADVRGECGVYICEYLKLGIDCILVTFATIFTERANLTTTMAPQLAWLGLGNMGRVSCNIFAVEEMLG